MDFRALPAIPSLSLPTPGTVGRLAVQSNRLYFDNGTAWVDITLPNSPLSGTDLGSATAAFREIFLYGSGTYGSHSIKFTGAPTGNRVLTLPDLTDTLVSRTSTDTLTNKTLTSPSINGGTHVAITDFGVRSTGTGAFDLKFINTENLTANRNLTISLGDASRTLTLSGNATISGTNTGDQTITLTGNVTGSGTGSFSTTIANNVVTNGMLSTIATGTFKGRVTASTGNVEDLTGTQATTLLDLFTSTLKGLVPGSGGGTANFLRADGTWAVPSGTGANTALSNLASVSINTALLAQTGVDLGSTANAFRDLYLYAGGTYGTHSLRLTGTPTGNRVITIPDATATLAAINLAQTWTSNQTYGSDILRATSPRITTSLFDTNGNTWISQVATGSAVNFIQVANGSTGNAAVITATGESNATLRLASSGTGIINIPGALVINATGISSNYPLQLGGSSKGGAYFGINTGSGAANDILNYAAVSNSITGSIYGFSYTATASTGFNNLFANGDSTNSTAHSTLKLQTNGASAGDPYFQCTVSGVTDWVFGLDNSVSGDPFVFSKSSTLGTTDIIRLDTTGLNLVSGAFLINGTSVLNSTTLGSGITASSLTSFGTSPTIVTPTISGAISFPDGVRQTFNPDGTTPGLNVGSHTADPSTPSNGDIWYDSTNNLLRARINGANVSLGSGGSGIGDPGANGIVVRTALNTTTARTLTGTTNRITITNGDGVSGNPTFDVGSLVVLTNQANTWSTGAQDFGSATSLKVPTSAGVNPTANGLIAYDSTANTWKVGVNGSTKTILFTDGTLPIATGISGLGTGIATFLATPSSANLITAITDETGSGSLVFGTSPTITTPTISGAISFPDNTRQTFNPGATNAGLNVGSDASDPSSPSNGDLWYNSTSNELKARINGANVALGAGGGGGGGITWSEVTGTTQALSADNGYIANNAAEVVFTLPASCAIGKIIRVAGKGAGGWQINQNSGQTIYFSDLATTTGTSGNISSTHRRDAVELVCITANTEFQVISSIGNITIV